MPRSSRTGELIFDLVVEKYARKRRKETEKAKQATFSAFNLTHVSESTEEHEFEDTTSSAESHMDNNQGNNAANNGGNNANNAANNLLCDHPNLSYKQPAQQGIPQQGFQQRRQYWVQQQVQALQEKPRRPLEEIVAELAQNSLKFQQET
ncbi:hypothetical protein C2S53_005326 [Perilla frutescens var. hirtella]|uniref:Uncharacterized protein n=1 Tax=Perilla frutescens var. hirtella TaxID=608512 RepID=A0AAD4PBB9_PERFH|nr:hypothetical protein C2S53_005326 [Perilla frutescens var. hirtella]